MADDDGCRPDSGADPQSDSIMRDDVAPGVPLLFRIIFAASGVLLVSAKDVMFPPASTTPDMADDDDLDMAGPMPPSSTFMPLVLASLMLAFELLFLPEHLPDVLFELLLEGLSKWPISNTVSRPWVSAVCH